MGNPTFLDSAIHPFRFLEQSITPVFPPSPAAEATAVLWTELSALGWTQNPANTFISPPNDAGRYIQVVVTDVSNLWRMDLYDDSGVLICSRSAYTNPSGDTLVRYFTGADYFYMEFIYGVPAQGRFVYAFMLDSFPDDSSFLGHPVIGHGINAANGASDGLGTLDYAFAVDNGVGNSVIQRVMASTTFGGINYRPAMPSGRLLFLPCRICQRIGGTTYVFTGKFPQALIGPQTVIIEGQYVVPIDYSTTAQFMPTLLYYSTTHKLYMRKA